MGRGLESPGSIMTVRLCPDVARAGRGRSSAKGRLSVKSATTRLRIACIWTAAVLGLMVGTTVELKADSVVYATADNGSTFLFGSLDLTTGQFSTDRDHGHPVRLADRRHRRDPLRRRGRLPPLHHQPFGCDFAIRDGHRPVEHPFPGFLGLASEGSAGFFADSVTAANTSTTAAATATLVHISADGTSSSVVGTMGTTFGSYNSGNLAFGPDGKLYFNCWNSNTNQVPTLFSVNTATGAVTQIGSNLGTTDPLAIGSVGGILYGVDTFGPPPRASTPSTRRPESRPGSARVSGLPVGYTLDTITFSSVPEPSR